MKLKKPILLSKIKLSTLVEERLVVVIQKLKTKVITVVNEGERRENYYSFNFELLASCLGNYDSKGTYKVV